MKPINETAFKSDLQELLYKHFGLEGATFDFRIVRDMSERELDTCGFDLSRSFNYRVHERYQIRLDFLGHRWKRYDAAAGR